MIRVFASPQFLLFILTGGTAVTVNFRSGIVFNQWLDYSTAIILAYLVVMVTAFVLARPFVFTQSDQDLRRSVLIITLVNVVAVAQTWSISMGWLTTFCPRHACPNLHQISPMPPASYCRCSPATSAISTGRSVDASAKN